VKFTLTINADNRAFQPNPIPELKRILRYVTAKLEAGHTESLISDINGNLVGDYRLSYG
jgi:hypothetical protein